MPQQLATRRAAEELTPEVLRNEIVQNIDQMERVEVGGGESGYASAMSVFPTVNLDDPEQGYWTWTRIKGPMSPSSLSSESPLGTLELPDKREITTTPYKKKYAPEKGAQTRLGATPFDVFQQAASEIRTELFLTREQISWRGNSATDGMIGEFGQQAHPDIPTDNVLTPATAWSDSANAQIYDDITSITHNIMTNGMLSGSDNVAPTMFVSPGVMRDIKRSADIEDRLAGVRIKSVTSDVVQEIVDEELGNIRRVMVFLPRTDAAGNYLDEAGNIVETAEEAARDNVLEPYNPATGTKSRHVVIGRPGAGSAYIPWFSDELEEYASAAPPHGQISVDNTRGFITQQWTDNDPLVSTYKGMQSIGFHVHHGENWSVIRNV